MGPGATLLDDFARVAAAHPERALFVTSDGAVSYGQAAAMIARAVDVLVPGTRVLCLAEDTIPLALFLLAAGYAGVVPSVVSPVFSTEYAAAVARHSAAVAVFTTPAFAARAAALGLPVWCHGEALFADASDDGTAAARLAARAAAIGGGDPFVLQPTAGSTGTPKLVLRPFAAFARYARFVGDEVDKLGITAPRILAICSLSHAFAGHMFALALRLGAELAVPRAIDLAASLAEVRALDPEILPMTPRVLAALARQAPTGRLLGARARLVIGAGGTADVPTFTRLRTQHVEVLELYGSSEASVVAVTPLGGWRPGRAGVPVADVELELAPDGELIIRSPGLALGYHGERDALVGRDGFHRTGDLGRLDPDGYLQVLGRKRDVFCTPEGSNIYPARIEAMLESLERVEQAIVLGDGKSFVTAHLVIRAPGAPGWIDCTAERGLYDAFGELLRAVNARLELIEHVVAFALYREPFPAAVYRAVAGAKIARDRRAFVAAFALADHLYAEALPDDSPMLVPPRQRCFADRVRAYTG